MGPVYLLVYLATPPLFYLSPLGESVWWGARNGNKPSKARFRHLRLGCWDLWRRLFPSLWTQTGKKRKEDDAMKPRTRHQVDSNLRGAASTPRVVASGEQSREWGVQFVGKRWARQSTANLVGYQSLFMLVGFFMFVLAIGYVDVDVDGACVYVWMNACESSFRVRWDPKRVIVAFFCPKGNTNVFLPSPPFFFSSLLFLFLSPPPVPLCNKNPARLSVFRQ